ncbi:MAG TPA: hypothetical protein VMY36_00815 [Patescibacteria group bacterium]|nr:hypothetical protein [Patescibacteria group bacterium]
MVNKYQELLIKKEEAKAKLDEALKNFKGVKHEDSATELQESQLNVARAHLISIEEEIKNLRNE